MIYKVHKILVLLKNYLNYLKDSILECFFKEYNRLSFYFFIYLFIYFNIFFSAYNDGKFKSWRKKTIKDIRNPFRLKKELNYTAIKDTKNLLD